MIPIKYTLLLFVLFSVVVPGISKGQGKKRNAQNAPKASGDNSAVVPQAGNSGERKGKQVPLNQNAPKASGKSSVVIPHAGNSGEHKSKQTPPNQNAPQASGESSVVDPQVGNSEFLGNSSVNKQGQVKIKDQIESDRIYIANNINKQHSNGSLRRISLKELMKLWLKIENPVAMPHWPPSANIGGVYMTEPFNFVSISVIFNPDVLI